MDRALKKIIYGTFYVVLFGGALVWFFVNYLEPAPSCVDRIQNQGETGVDCGGPCAACAVRALQPLRPLTTAEKFQTSGGALVLYAGVVNPNAGYHTSSFTYTFSIYGTDGGLMETLSGTDTAYAGEQRYLVEDRARESAGTVGKVVFTVANPPPAQWVPVSQRARPSLALAGSAVTDITGNAITVRGTVANTGTTPSGRVMVVVMLYDRSGSELFPSLAPAISSIVPGATEPFTAFFPADGVLAANVDPAATRVYIESQWQ